MNNFKTKNSNKYSQIFAFCNEFNSKYEIIDKIGSGQSSNVFLVKHKQNGKKYALKAFNHLTTQGKPENLF